MRHALVDAQNVVQNVVVYDPAKAGSWVPPQGMTMIEIEDWVNIGDDANKPKPVAPVKDAAALKAERNAAYKNDLALVASFDMEKKNNPGLTFSDYLDSLELKAKDM